MSEAEAALFGIDKLNVARSEIPAVTHVDYSARIQTVHRETNPRHHALCEFGVFRFIWLASDVPANDFVDGIVRYASNQSGSWRVRDEIAAPYRINAQG